jgi:hypothetical protein
MRLSGLATAASIVGAIVLTAAPAWAQKARTPPAKKAGKPVATKFGALAVDRSQAFAFGWAYDHPSRDAAREFALEECKKREGNCAVVVEFSGEGCASYHTLSAEDGSAYGWGTAPTQEAAQSRSLRECNNFAGNQAVCSNHVWSCNSEDVAAFKVLREEPVRPKLAKTDCLVKFEVAALNGKDDWVDDYKSPVYRLRAQDCPLTTSSQFHSFHHAVWDGKVSSSESNPEKKNPALQKKGLDMAAVFYDWMMARPSPTPGTHWRTSVSVSASTSIEENVKYLGETTGQSNSTQVHGICLAYAPPGVTPVATYGTDRCRVWIR